MKRKLKLVFVLAVLIVAGAAVYMMFFSNTVIIKDKALKSFNYSCGGGMAGGYSRLRVTLDGDHALVRSESAQWHNDDPVVEEYAVDPAILSEIGDIFWKYHMNRWNNKKFSNIFVADGESESYEFGFSDGRVRFSSQLYPKSYADKLKEIDDVISKYAADAQKRGE